ncbi:uncharacterized protein LOC132198374 [Neocloeon triangulifer]|uniref:uncharacterized protein LOC132198374 n=1 Tax=Neocloeon triangulifer TaxID=2078957 RepID=UPI00286F10C1|nr:uncharacterized protein LOC132198374 [Neocloeon triangulifer]
MPKVLLVVLGLLLALGSSLGSSTTTTTETPKEHKAAPSSKEIVTKIVKKIKVMADQHKLPSWLQEQIVPYGDSVASGHPHVHIVSNEVEPTPDPNYSITGYHIKGMLGFAEYLILLILLKGSLDHVAERYKLSNKIKEDELIGKKSRRATIENLDELSRTIVKGLKHRKFEQNKTSGF